MEPMNPGVVGRKAAVWCDGIRGMSERKLRYSERKAIAETGSLGALQDEPSPALRAALRHLVGEARSSNARIPFKRAAENACAKHFGLAGEWTLEGLVNRLELDDFLDFIEIFRETASVSYSVRAGHGVINSYKPLSAPEAEINELFDRHRFGYRLDGGEIRKIGSPVLDQVVVGPALFAAKRPGWEEAERSFREAIQHQRGGSEENDDALTAANAAVEAALKAAGFKGANLGPLAQDFKKSSLVPAELRGVPEALDSLLKRLSALRSSHGDSHGKHSGAEPVPQELVDLAIHWAGAFIVYLGLAIPAS